MIRPIKFFILLSIIFCSNLIALKILMLTSKFPYAPRLCVNNQIAGLIDAGHKVFILARYPGTLFNCPVFQKYQLKKRTFYNTLPNHLRDFDVIYAQYGDEGLRALDLMDKGIISGKLIVSFRGGDATRAFTENPSVYAELFCRSTLCLPNCDYFKKILIDHGCNPNKIRILYSGVDTHTFSFFERKLLKKNEPLRILSIARLTPMKGLDYAIRAMKKLRHIYTNFHYKIIGSMGRSKNKIHKLIIDLNLQNYIEIVSYMKQDELAQEMKKAHLFLHTSVTTALGEAEGIPNVIKEAMLTGLPIIATKHAGIVEIIENNVSGILVPEKDSNAIYKSILYFIKNQEFCIAMADRGANMIRDTFNMYTTNQNLFSILKDLCG
jgi:colanic acid/amylovoran biosynthesis glycosyltransferase